MATFCLVFACLMVASCLGVFIAPRFFPEYWKNHVTRGRSSLPTYSDATKNDPPSYTECFRETQQLSTYSVNV